MTPDGGVRHTRQVPTDGSGTTPPLLGTRTVVVAGLLVAVGTGLSAGWLLKPGPATEPPPETASLDAREVRPSVAVLPFDNHFPDPEQSYFADGLAKVALWEIPLNAWAGDREAANVRAAAAEGWVRL